MLVLGFDPGYALIGWGVVESTETGLYSSIEYGAIRTDSDWLSQKRLSYIYREARRISKEYQPQYVVVEQLFFSNNRKTAAGVFQARGVILAAVGECDLQLIELTPNSIKQAITGNGRASKKDMIEMVQRILKLKEKVRPDDIADALAGALAGHIALSNERLLEQGKIK